MGKIQYALDLSGSAGKVLQVNSSSDGFDYVNTVQTASYASTASYALYAVSASYEINYETSSSYAETASVAPLYLPLAGGMMSGDINVNGNYIRSVDSPIQLNVNSSAYAARYYMHPNSQAYISVDFSVDGSPEPVTLTISDSSSLTSLIPGFSGLRYGGDYSPNYTDRSLVDKGYVNSISSSIISTIGVISNEVGRRLAQLTLTSSFNEFTSSYEIFSGSIALSAISFSSSLSNLNVTASNSVLKNLSELHDVDLTNARTGSFLYKSGSLWKDTNNLKYSDSKLEYTGSFNITGSLSVNNDLVSTNAQLSSSITGSPNYIAKFNTSNSLNNSIIYQQSNTIGINNTSPSTDYTFVVGNAISLNPTTYMYGGINFPNQTNQTHLKVGSLQLMGLGAASNYTFTYNNCLIDFRTTYARLSKQDNYPIYLSTNGTTRMTILGDGNIGIGTTTPTEKLHVSGSTNFGCTSMNCDSRITGSLIVSNSINLIGNQRITGSLTVSQGINGDIITTPIYLTYNGTSGSLSGTNGATLASPGNWAVTKFNAHYYCDDKLGSLIITIPDSDATNQGKTIQFSKSRLVQSNNTVTIKTVSGQNIAQNDTFVMYASDERFEFITCNFGSNGSPEYKYRVTLGTDNDPHILRVSNHSSLYTTLKSATDYANNYISNEAIILLEPGTYDIGEPITVTHPNLKISGRGPGVTTLVHSASISASAMLTFTNNFEIDNITFTGSGDYAAIQISGSEYCEIQNVEIDRFERGICFAQPGTEMWLFNSIIKNNSLAGVCNLGGASIGVSECTFENNNYGINLYTGSEQRHSIQNTIFLVPTGSTGVYWNSALNTYKYALITGNSFYGEGTFVDGFIFNNGDRDFEISNNVGLRNYAPSAYIEITGSTTTTTLTTQDTYYKLNGTNTGGSFGVKFAVTDNKAQYLPTTAKYLHIMVSGEIEVNANGQNLKVAIYKNGDTNIMESMVRCVTQNIGYGFALQKFIEVNTNDYFEIWAVNTTSAGKNVILDNVEVVIKE